MKYAVSPQRRRWIRHTVVAIGIVGGVVACGSDDSTSNASGGAGGGSAPVGNDITIAVNATSAQEVPANDSTATATGNLTFNDSTGALSGTLTTSGVTATMAHIHDGFAGANGSVVIGLQISGDTLTVPAGTTLTAAQLATMQAGGYYVNVHSALNPGGEVRGQIFGTGISVLSASLDGNQEVPPVTSSASGSGYLTVNANDNTLTANIAVDGATDATMAHVHTGASGANGGVLVGLNQSATDAGSWSVAAAPVTAADITAVLAGGTYFNVHTPGNTSGEIRGQISSQLNAAY